MRRPADFGLVDLDAIATAALQPVIEDLGVGVDKVRPAVVLQDLQPLQRLVCVCVCVCVCVRYYIYTCIYVYIKTCIDR